MKKIIIWHLVVLLVPVVVWHFFANFIVDSLENIFPSGELFPNIFLVGIIYGAAILFISGWIISLVIFILRNRLRANPPGSPLATNQPMQTTETTDKHRRALVSTAISWLTIIPGMIVFSNPIFYIISIIIGCYNLFALKSYSNTGKISKLLVVLSIIASAIILFNGLREIMYVIK